MAYWLIKSDPETYSIDDFQKEGKTDWDGVRNYQARNNLAKMVVGDRALFYHSNIGKSIMGIAEITKEYNTTTIINTHDMNSVMTIGEKIVYLRKGIKEWEGTKDILITSDNKYLIDFVYSSELFKELREYLIKINKTSIDNIITTIENETDQENI